MAERPDLGGPGVLTTRAPIRAGDALSSDLYCDLWIFQTDEDLGIAFPQVRGPASRAWFAVAISAPFNDPDRPGEPRQAVLALVPAENVLGFVAGNKAPTCATRLGPEAPAP